MHLFSFENEEDNSMFPLNESMFCEMARLSTSTYIDKWKNIPKTSEQKVVLGKLYTNKESNIIMRLQANNIMVCTFKTNDNQTILYLSCITKDNILILSELTLLNTNFIYGKIKYKSESCQKEVEFENFISMILSEVEVDNSSEDEACR